MDPERLVDVYVGSASSPFLQEESLEHLKDFLKSATTEEEAAEVFDALHKRLQFPDAQIRLSALHLVDAFFLRSKLFRRICSGRLGVIVEGGVGDLRKPLPLPREAADELHHYALHCLAKWRLRFNRLYPQISMGCEFVEGWMKCKLPDVPVAYVPIIELRERQRRQEEYDRLAWEADRLFEESRRIANETAHLLAIVDASTIEWEDLPMMIESHLDVTDNSSDLLSLDREHMASGTESPTKRVMREVMWIDPVVEEQIVEALGLIQDRLVPKLQRFICTAMLVHMDSVTNPESRQRTSALRHAVELRNVLLDRRNAILKLGIQLNSRRKLKRRPKEQPCAWQDNEAHTTKHWKRRKKIEAPDPTSAPPGYPFALRIDLLTGEPIQSNDTYPASQHLRRQSQESPQESVRSEEGEKRTPSHILHTLLREAPSLSQEQATELMQSTDWQKPPFFPDP